MTQLHIRPGLSLPLSEINMSGIRAQGAGGQNVNKVSSAVMLRFDIAASSLPEKLKIKLLNYPDSRITGEGLIIIKAQRFRTFEKNKEDALDRLRAIVVAAGHEQKARTATKPSRSSRKRRVDRKVKRGRVKSLRGKVKQD